MKTMTFIAANGKSTTVQVKNPSVEAMTHDMLSIEKARDSIKNTRKRVFAHYLDKDLSETEYNEFKFAEKQMLDALLDLDLALKYESADCDVAMCIATLDKYLPIYWLAITRSYEAFAECTLVGADATEDSDSKDQQQATTYTAAAQYVDACNAISVASSVICIVRACKTKSKKDLVTAVVSVVNAAIGVVLTTKDTNINSKTRKLVKTSESCLKKLASKFRKEA